MSADNGHLSVASKFGLFPSMARLHCARLHSTNPIERINGEIDRRTYVVGIIPNDDAMIKWPRWCNYTSGTDR